MSKYKKARNFFSKVTKTVFPKLKLQDASNPLQYIGTTILAQTELDQPFEEIKIKEIQGCVAEHLQKHFQVNGTHLVSMFSFFVQKEEGRLPTKEEEDEFNLATEIKKIEKIDGKKDKH